MDDNRRKFTPIGSWRHNGFLLSNGAPLLKVGDLTEDSRRKPSSFACRFVLLSAGEAASASLLPPLSDFKRSTSQRNFKIEKLGRDVFLPVSNQLLPTLNEVFAASFLVVRLPCFGHRVR